MSPMDRPDPSLLSDAALVEELKRRREARARGVCDYCGERAIAANACGEGARHTAAARHETLLWAKLDAPLPPSVVLRLRDTEAAQASGAPPYRPVVQAANELLGELARDLMREVDRLLLRHRAVPVDLAHLMTEIGEVATALLERGAPSRGELLQVAAVAIAWADVAQRTSVALAEGRDRATDERQAIVLDEASRFESLDRATGPAQYTMAAVLLRQAAQERAGRRGGLQITKEDGQRLLVMLDAMPDARATALAGEAALAIRLGVARSRGGPMLSNVRALALATHLEDCAILLPRGTIGACP